MYFEVLKFQVPVSGFYLCLIKTNILLTLSSFPQCSETTSQICEPCPLFYFHGI